MNIYRLLVLLACLGAAIMTSGCASTARGINTDFIIQTEQDGVEIFVDLETSESRKAFDWRDRRDASSKNGTIPDFEFYACETIPCKLHIPRKHTFSVLAYKEGYIPQVFEITHIHKKELEKLVKAGTLAGTTATLGGFGVATGTAWGSSTVAMGGAASVAGPAIIIGIPFMIFLAGSSEVDKENMANYDFYPNPLIIELQPLALNSPQVTREQVIAQYKKQRIDYALDPQRTGMCYYKSTRMSCWRLNKLEKRIERSKR